MNRQEEKRERIERDLPLEISLPATVKARLIAWLEDQSHHHYGAGRTHDLHLWDWEVDLLLTALRADMHGGRRECGRDDAMRRAEEQKPLMTSFWFGSVGDARRPGHDAPLPGKGWVREEDR